MLHAQRQFHCTSDTVFDAFPRAQFEVVQASAPAGSGGVPPPVKPSTGKPGETPVPPAAGTAALPKIRAVAETARALRALRHEFMPPNGGRCVRSSNRSNRPVRSICVTPKPRWAPQSVLPTT